LALKYDTFHFFNSNSPSNEHPRATTKVGRKALGVAGHTLAINK